MENAVKEFVKTNHVRKREKSVSKIDYRIIFCAAAAFLVGGAAVFGVFSPKSVAFFAMAIIILMSTYLLCKALIAWEFVRVSNLDQSKQMLTVGKAAFESLASTYSRSICRKNVMEVDELRELFIKLNDEVCGRCSAKKNCWDIYTGRTEQYIRTLVDYAEKGQEDLMEGADRKNGFTCESRQLMAIYTRNLWYQMQTEYKWKKKLESSKIALSSQFEGTAEIFEKALRSIGGSTSVTGRDIISEVKVGISKYAKDGVVCGDSCAGSQINDNTWLFLLSDGMGSGKRAAGESMLTVNTLYQFMKAGFSPEYALSALNSILVLKSDDEIFSTVDIATLNMKNGVVNFYKAGSANAYIKRNGLVEVIKRGSLPMGIVEKARAENVERRLRPDDIVIMVSDGIADAGKRTECAEEEKKDYSWVEETLIGIKSTDPQTVADLLLSKAVERYGSGEKDDMSILVFAVN